jgi:MFS family permease
MSQGTEGADPRRWLALALLGTAFFMVILDGTIVYVALPSIDEALGFSAGGLQWVMSAYLLTSGGLLLLGGRSARPARAPAHVHGRRGPVCGIVAAVRARLG